MARRINEAMNNGKPSAPSAIALVNLAPQVQIDTPGRVHRRARPHSWQLRSNDTLCIGQQVFSVSSHSARKYGSDIRQRGQ